MSDFSPTYILDAPVVGVDDVADEVQHIQVKATGGEFTVTFDGETTAKVAWNVSAANLQTALLALPQLDAGDVVVTGGPGDEKGTTPYVLTFGGAYEGINVPEVTADDEKLTIGEAAGSATVSTVTVGGSATTAVQKGTGLADRTKDVSPLTGKSPAELRTENPEGEYA